MLTGYYIFTPSTDMFFVMDNKRTTDKTLQTISDAINKHWSIETTPETIKNRMLKANLEYKNLGFVELINITDDKNTFSYGAYKPNGKEWNKTTEIYLIQKGTLIEFSYETKKVKSI